MIEQVSYQDETDSQQANRYEVAGLLMVLP